MKKIAFKSLLLLLIGIFTAIVIYPTLHEMGHVIIGSISDAKTIEIDFCRLVFRINANYTGWAAVGSIVLPVLISNMMTDKCIFIWFIKVVIKCNNVLYALAFYVDLIYQKQGYNGYIEDVKNIVEYRKDKLWLYYLVLIVIAVKELLWLKETEILDTVYKFIYNNSEIVLKSSEKNS